MENYNNKLRKIISDNLESIMISKFCSLKDAIMIYHQYLNELFNNNEIIKVLYLSTIYLDSYKFLSYRQKHGINKPIETEIFSMVDKIDSYEDLLQDIQKNPNLFCEMLESTYDYNESNGLAKRIMIASLTKEENKKLITISPLHEQDLDLVKEKLTFEKLIKNIKSQNKYYNQVMTIKFDNGLVYQTAGLLKELYYIDSDNIKNILLEIALKDYVISKKVVDKIPENESIKLRIKKYEEESTENIIIQMIRDTDFLVDAIYQIIDLYINKSYLEIPLDEKEIESEEDITTKKLKNNN